jgi:hypothetical protein
MVALSGDPFYDIRCKFCLSTFHLDLRHQCQQPECIAKASRERTDALLAARRRP